MDRENHVERIENPDIAILRELHDEFTDVSSQDRRDVDVIAYWYKTKKTVLSDLELKHGLPTTLTSALETLTKIKYLEENNDAIFTDAVATIDSAFRSLILMIDQKKRIATLQLEKKGADAFHANIRDREAAGLGGLDGNSRKILQLFLDRTLPHDNDQL